jgi:hypothetical protein
MTQRFFALYPFEWESLTERAKRLRDERGPTMMTLLRRTSIAAHVPDEHVASP